MSGKVAQIYVDGDACPVKDEVIRVAERHGVRVYIVSNQGLRPLRHPLVEQIMVPEGPDVADDWIAERAQAGDVAVTADIPLAARCLEKGALVLGPSGKAFTEESIGMALAMRDLKAHLRETGEDKGYNRSFSPRDRSDFLEALERAVQQLQR